MRAVRVACLAMVGVTIAGHAMAQLPPEGSIQGSGIVRVCDLDGEHLDSAGDQYYRESNDFLAGPPSGFRRTFSCVGQTQSYDVFTTADPKGDERFGFRMVSQASIAVTVEPQFTEIYGDSAITSPMCLVSDSIFVPPVKLLVRAKGSRSLPVDCMDDYANTGGDAACSGVRGRVQGFGATGFVNAIGNVLTPGTFFDLTAPQNKQWTKVAHFTPYGTIPGSYLIGSLSGTLITRAMHTPSGRAFGDLRFYVEVPVRVERSDCPFSDAGRPRFDVASAVLPRPAWFVDAGDAIPDDFTLSISPPTGPITINQEFDLSVMAATNGAAVTGMSGNIDGQDVSGPLAACLQPTSPLSGVAGSIYTCRGLSGGFLAGVLGAGAHTLSINVSLSDGRTITDSATWTILR